MFVNFLSKPGLINRIKWILKSDILLPITKKILFN